MSTKVWDGPLYILFVYRYIGKGMWRTVKCGSLGCCFVYCRMVWQRKVIVIGGGIKDTKFKAMER